MNLLKIFRFPDFIQYFPDFLQRFPDFSQTKFFKVRKCERRGSLNPRLICVQKILTTTNPSLVGFRKENKTLVDKKFNKRECSILRKYFKIV